MFNLTMSSSYGNSSGRSLCLAWLLGICTLFVAASVGTTVFAQPAPKIVTQIEQIKSNTFQEQLQNANLTEPPNYISIRIYKKQAELEIWAGNNNKENMTLLAIYPVCAMGFAPGTKLIQGDERTPEGSFALDFYNSSKNWFMHINLSPDHIDDEGNVKTGPAFYACTDYPTEFDKQLSASIGVKQPGSSICLHGNCTSLGCASMQNHDFIEIYYWLAMHDSAAYGAPRVHILPFRFYESCKTNINSLNPSENHICATKNYALFKTLALIATFSSKELNLLGKEKIAALWKHIGDRELLFIKNPTPANAELNLSMNIFDRIE